MKSKLKVLLILLCLIPSVVSAKRGCCSHHGGVSGCSSSGKQICRDGTLSPTCTCTPTNTYTYGCTDKGASNYNSKANKDDGSCVYYIYGCTDTDADNYNEDANKDDGSCIYYVYGCTDKGADNYDSAANKDDGSCEYSVELANVNVDANDDEEFSGDGVSAVLGIGTIAGGYYLLKKRKK